MQVSRACDRSGYRSLHGLVATVREDPAHRRIKNPGKTGGSVAGEVPQIAGRVPPLGAAQPASGTGKTGVAASGGNAGGNSDSETADLLRLWEVLDSAGRGDLLSVAHGLVSRQRAAEDAEA